jgi:hypothetical protein
MQMGTMDSTGATASTIAAGEFTIENIEFTEGAGSSGSEDSNAIVFGGETDAIANPGNAYYWTEFGGISGGTYENGVISFSVVNGGNWYSNQIFLKNADLVAGKTYKLSCTITSEAAGNIKINGQVIAIVAGENHIEITVIEDSNNNGNDAADASFALQCGNEKAGTVIPENTICISNLTFTEI